MDIATVVGGASLLTAVGFGLYQLRKQKESDRQRKEMEQRLQRKEDLEELSEHLQELRNQVTTLCDHLIHPRLHEDMEFALYNLGRDVLSYVHAANEKPVVSIDELRFHYPGERKDIFPDEVKEIVEFYNRDAGDGYVFVNFNIEGGQDVLPYPATTDIGTVLNGFSWVYQDLQKIQDRDENLLTQFESTLIEDVEDSLNQLTTACFGQLFENYDGVEFNPDDYEGSIALEDAIYSEFLLSEDVYTAVDELEEIAERIGEIQKTVISTSFS